MKHIRIDDEKSAIEYLESVLHNWKAWHSHHYKLVKALQTLLEAHHRRNETESIKHTEEVVRCKNCQFVCFNSSSETYHCVRRGYFSEQVNENDFCSRGSCANREDEGK